MLVVVDVVVATVAAGAAAGGAGAEFVVVKLEEVVGMLFRPLLLL